RLNFDEIARITAFILLVAGLAFLIRKLTKLLLGHISCSVAANYIENKRSFNQQLVTAIEYYENKQDYPYSKALAEQLVLKVEQESGDFSFDSTVEKWQGYALGAVIVFGLVAASFYARDNYVYFSSYFARLISPLASVEPLSSTRLESITKDIVAEPDTPVRFAAEIQGRMPESGKLVVVNLEHQSAESSREQVGGSLKAKGFGDGSAQAIPKLRLRLPPIEDGKTAQFEVTKSFSQPGKFRYRFETDKATTQWHELNISQAPEIESMTAKVTVPRRPPRRKWIKPYTERIRSNTLEVIPDSSVTLSVKSTDKLSKIIATAPDGKTIARQLNGEEEFTFHFTANKNGSVQFSLVNEHGLVNENVPDLQVIVKTDEAPEFKLVSPDGDYLATNVASVPVTFEVTDDFGLESAKICMEIPGRQPIEITAPVEEGIKNTEFTHTIELEKYDLTVGDGVLLYAVATDIDTGSQPANRTSSSDVYFIEIRPYRQNWVPMPGGGESNAGGSPPVELLNILEYLRAIIKKTWAIASKPELTEQDRSRLGFINQDVQYCAEQVSLIRDDSQYGFEEPHKAVLNEVIRYLKLASGHLASHDATAAMTPEKSAYRILRKFILELELSWSPPPSGQSPQPEKPDSVKLQENPEFEGYEKERIEAQLKKMQQKLDKLTREQGELQWSFENFLEQQAEKKAPQQNSDDRQSERNAEKQNQDTNSAGQQSDSTGQKDQSTSSSQSAGSSQDSTPKEDSAAENQSSGKGSGTSGASESNQNDSASQENTQGRSLEQNKSSSDAQSATRNQDDNKKDSSENQSSQGQSPGDGKSASDSQSSSDGQDGTGKQGTSSESQSTGASGTPDDKQGDSQSRQSSQGQSPGDSKSISEAQGSSDGTNTDGRATDAQGQGRGQDDGANTEARLRMLQAKQRALQEQVSQLKQELQQLPESSDSGNSRSQAQEHLSEATARMKEFQAEMAEARFQAEMDERRSNDAVALMDSAKSELDEANKALGRELTLSDDEKLAQEARDMAEQLTEDADAFAESVTDVERQEMLARLEAAKRLLEIMPEPQWSTVNKGGSPPSGASHVLTRNPNIASAEMARQMARRFWSIAISAKKRRQQVLENEPSDVEFYGQENEFFENAARYDQEPVKK
ncbi:MAG: hypothetical protein ACYS3S_03755, partial [Planctomycetota bacterium]